MSKKMDNALGIYTHGIRDGHPEEAMRRFTGARYTQHSGGVPDQQQGFIAFFTEFLARNAKREIRVLRCFEDGPLVFLHVIQTLNDGAAEWVTMDVFDSDSDERIIEHWDVIEAYQRELTSGEEMLGGATQPTDLEKTEANKIVVREYVKRVLTAGLHEQLDDFIAEGITQRIPNMPSGREALRRALADGTAGKTEMLTQLMGKGDMVVALSKVVRENAEHAVFDLYRVQEGKICEHWATSEEIAPRSQWANTGKF
tara:strand:- start:6564 stop:7331 length:768 start_codon:yes stop_codon:yes gene_type:complete